MKTMRTDRVPIEDVKADPANLRQHDERQIDLIASSLGKWKQQKPIVVDADGVIIAGHGVLAAAKKLGWTHVDVVRSSLTGTDRVLYGIADNRLAELSRWDNLALAEVLTGLDAADLDSLGFTAEDMTAITAPPNNDGLVDPDDVPAPPDEATTKPGDLWVLGNHRLLCGDATNRKDVQRLLDGARPEICVTDPPYGVNYDPAWRNRAAAAGHLAYSGRRVGKVENDDRADWSEAWALFPGNVIYSWHPPGATSLVHAAALEGSGFKIRMQIIWAKSNFPIGRGDYHVRHEPCWYAVRDGEASRRTDDRTQTTLWEINLDKNVEGGHSTQKPVECMARPIRNHIFLDVYEPFCGSGTTVVACEMLGRRCFALEISPRYCDVIVQRWEKFTGKKAERITPTPRDGERRGVK